MFADLNTVELENVVGPLLAEENYRAANVVLLHLEWRYEKEGVAEEKQHALSELRQVVDQKVTEMNAYVETH